jgi:hypothetical protein
MAVFELGRYSGVDNPTVSPGLGIWLAVLASVVYVFGAVIKWGSRLRRS